MSFSRYLHPEEEHDGSAGVVGDLPGYEGGHHPAQQGRQDRHQVEGGQRPREDVELVVGHGQDGGDEESLVPDLRDEDNSYTGGWRDLVSDWQRDGVHLLNPPRKPSSTVELLVELQSCVKL